VEAMVHAFDALNGHQKRLRHITAVLAERHNQTLTHLWGPNEIYVVGERRP